MSSRHEGWLKPWPQPQEVKVPVSVPWITEAEHYAVSLSLRDGWIGPPSPSISGVEQQLSAAFRAEAALVSNGTAALEVALRALDIGPGDEVVVPALTYAATASAVVAVGAEPVFCDVRADTWGADADSVARMISSRTRAIIVVHLYGCTTGLLEICGLAKSAGIAVIEDCAETFLGSSGEGPAGSLGDVATFSFFANKLLTSGEGGAVMSRDSDLMNRIRLIRGQGMDPARRYYFLVPGTNVRIGGLQAALLSAQLNRIAELWQARETVETAFASNLAGLMSRPVPYGAGQRSPWLFSARLIPSLVERRTRIAESLASIGVETRPVFYPLPLMPAFSRYRADSLDVSVEVSRASITLPTGYHVGEAIQSQIVETIRGET